MSHSTRQPTRISEEIANSEAVARLMALGLINVDVVSDEAASTPQTMYRLSDKCCQP